MSSQRPTYSFETLPATTVRAQTIHAGTLTAETATIATHNYSNLTIASANITRANTTDISATRIQTNRLEADFDLTFGRNLIGNLNTNLDFADLSNVVSTNLATIQTHTIDISDISNRTYILEQTETELSDIRQGIQDLSNGFYDLSQYLTDNILVVYYNKINPLYLANNHQF